MNTIFTARYAGLCADCGERIHEGDEVAYSAEREVVQAACINSLDPAPSLRGVCEFCFISLPLSATSDVCDECRDA